MQRQAVDAVLAADKVVEDPGHNVQSTLPVLDLNFPITHAVQDPPSAPVNPAIHLQLVATVLPAGELEDAGHWMQIVAPAREYVSAAQLTQTEAAAMEYVPAAQLLQTDAEAAEKDPAVQLLQTEAVARENEPARQVEQTEAAAGE